jgi:hypothetical protein
MCHDAVCPSLLQTPKGFQDRHGTGLGLVALPCLVLPENGAGDGNRTHVTPARFAEMALRNGLRAIGVRNSMSPGASQGNVWQRTRPGVPCLTPKAWPELRSTPRTGSDATLYSAGPLPVRTLTRPPFRPADDPGARRSVSTPGYERSPAAPIGAAGLPRTSQERKLDRSNCPPQTGHSPKNEPQPANGE